MIMGLESFGVEITGEIIKAKLLQDVEVDCNKQSGSSNTTFFGKKFVKKNKFKKGIKCYNCNKKGHYKSECRAPVKRKKHSNVCSSEHGSDEDEDERILAWMVHSNVGSP